MRNHSSLRNACAKFSLAVALTAASFVCVAADWDDKQYNPKPTAGDVVLPMPCGGAMVFRKVDTEADGPLGDQTVRLGDPNPEAGYMENAIDTHVAGAFLGEKPRTRYFLLGKYELTQLQYQSVMLPSCPGLTPWSLPTNTLCGYSNTPQTNCLARVIQKVLFACPPKRNGSLPHAAGYRLHTTPACSKQAYPGRKG